MCRNYLIRSRAYIVIVAALAALSACSYEEMAANLIPEAESEFARDFIQRLQDHDFEYVKSQSSAELLPQLSDDNLLELANYFPSGSQLSVELIGSRTHSSNSGWFGSFTFEYEFEDGWALANATITRIDGKTVVSGIQVYQTTASQRELNSFSAVAMSPDRVFMLFVTVAIPVFMIFTCITVYRTPIPTRKKRWYLISFLGVMGFEFNWTTGVLSYQLISVHILGSGIAAAGHAAPWILSFTAPLGAILFWIKRKDLMNQPGPGGPAEVSSEADSEGLRESTHNEENSKSGTA